MIPHLDFSTDQKVVLLGDTHWGARNDSPLFYNHMAKFFGHLFDHMENNGIRLIVQFGDLFDRRKYINFVTLHQARTHMLEPLRQKGFHMVVFVGNHDTPFKNTIEVNALDLLLQSFSDVVTIVNTPTEITLGSKGVKALMVPWICQDNHQSAFEALEATDAQYCFGHFEIVGYQMYAGCVCDKGLDKKIFRKFKHVYSGHFHHVSTNDNITYIGSPYQLMWSDYGDPRGFFVMDTNTQLVDPVWNDFHMFHSFQYDDEQLSKSQVESYDWSKFTKTYVRLVIKKMTDQKLFDLVVSKLNSVEAVTHTVDMTSRSQTTVQSETIQAESISDTLKRASSTLGDRAPQAYKLLLELYNEASNATAI